MKRTLSLFALIVIASASLFATGIQESDAPAAPDQATVAALVASGSRVESVARHATGFRVVKAGDLTVVTVTRPWQGATDADTLNYVLYQAGSAAPVVEDADLVIAVPIESIVTMSTTFLPHLTALDRLDTLEAVDSVAFAYSPEVHRLFNDGNLVEVGSGPQADVERLLAIDPDLIMVNSYGGEWDAQPVLEQAGLPVVVSGDWVETSPLGRAEWLLFTALFVDELDSALEAFSRIEQEYTRLTTIAAEADTRPTVLSNAPYQGTWAVPGGESYAARFIRDAGGDYVWADDESTGALFFDIESVYAEAGEADVWINPGTWMSLDQGRAEDERFTAFRAFENGQVFNNNRRTGPGGGNDYFESGATAPHVILADLIWAFHPDLVPEYEPFYYRKLK